MAVSRHQIEQCEGRVNRLRTELAGATEKLRGLRATMKEEKAAAKGGGAAAGAMTAPKVKAKAPKKAKPKVRSGTLAGAT